ncbi:glutamine amidotransferase-related protein, partial [Sulfurihydrogenibium azorense]|uniref:glutamine amidotransferase-related protein n=1 Tax=Sulfurihydrogenibium azorense TaxID=309806 RepID=UPI00391D9EE7
MHQEIVILDFGSQYTQLIARRIRELHIYSEILPYNTSVEEILKHNPKGIIFSGGPASVYEKDAPKPDERVYDLGLPILGICY